MSFLKSVLFGSEGSFNIFGTRVKFQNAPPLYKTVPSINGAGIVSKLALKCLNSDVFRLFTQSYMHVFVHEMSHAMAYKVLTGKNSKVYIFKDPFGGSTKPLLNAYLIDWQKTVINIAGPIGNITFATCKLVASVASKKFYWPLAIVAGSGAFIWMSGELLYAYVSVLNKDNGDFGCIARRGKTHLTVASIALISQYALGIFAAIYLI